MKKDILLSLKRVDLQLLRTFGELSILGIKSAVTVEDVVREEKIHGKTAIPFGVYLLKTRQSPKFSSSYYYSDNFKKLISKEEYTKLKVKLDYKPHLMIWITDVINDKMRFEFVLIHWGNDETDTEGCIIVGTTKDKKQVLRSRLKYQEIYPFIYEQVKLGNKYIEIK